jgi:hypothetical protein
LALNWAGSRAVLSVFSKVDWKAEMMAEKTAVMKASMKAVQRVDH